MEKVRQPQFIEPQSNPQPQGDFEGFFNTIDDFLFILDGKGNILKVNSTVINRLGYTEKELIGKPVLIIHPPERQEETGRIVSEMLQGKAKICPVPIISKSGIQIPVETRITQGIWQGKTALFGVTKDISQVKLSEEKFSKVFYLNPSACGLSNLEDHKYIEVNKAFYDLFGFKVNEVIGKTATELGILDDKTISGILSKADKDGKVVNAQADLKTKNGDIKHVALSAENIFIQDQKYRFTFVNDMTERKQAEDELQAGEEKFRRLVGNSHDIIYTLTNEGLFTFVSPAWTILLGHEVDQVVGHQFQSFVHPDDLAACLVWLQKVIESKQRQEGIEYRVKHLDGSWRWHTSSAVPLFDKSGVIVGIDGTARDISERKNNQESIQNYLHILTHDLRNSLGPILSISNTLSQTNFPPEEAKKYANLINISGRKMFDMMESYLLLEKIERRQVTLVKKVKTVLEIIDLIKKVFSTTDTLGCNLQVIQKGPETNFPQVNFFYKKISIDEGLFGSVMLNLFKNASEAASKTDKQVTVCIYGNDSSICISISNSGEISKEIQKNIFKKFITDKVGGTGIGVYSAKLITEALGGKLLYKPQVNNTEFIVEIPYEK